MRPHWKGLAVLIALAAVPAAGFHRLVRSPGSLIVDPRRPSLDHARRNPVREVGNDLTTVFLPRFAYVVGRLRAQGRLPLWDASGFGGRPLVGNPQAGVFYPPVWLAYLSGRPAALGWLTVGHLLGAAVGVYALTRSLGFSTPAALVAGGCFEASPYLIAHTFEGHYPHVWAACWYPWAFWATLQVTRGRPSGALALPVVLALTFLTGHPQEWYYLGLAVGLWALADVRARSRAGGVRAGLARAGLYAGLFGLSLALVAVEMVPEWSSRPWLLRTSVIPLRAITRYHLHLLNAAQLLNPFALGRPHEYFGHDNYWETVFSVGLAPLALAAVGIVRHPRRGLVRAWLALVVVTTVFAAGRRLGLFSLCYTFLPGMDRFRVPSRSLFLTGFGVSVLVGAGVDALLALRSREEYAGLSRRLRRSLLAVGAVVASLALIGAPSRPADVDPASYREILAAGRIAESGVLWSSLLGALALVGLTGRARGGKVVGAFGLGVLAVAELALHAQSLLVYAPVESFARGDALTASLRRGEDTRAGPVRVAAFATVYPDLRASLDRVEKTNVNDGFQIQHAADLYQQLYPFLDPDRAGRPADRPMDDAVDRHRAAVAQRVLDLMSVRYVLTDRRLPAEELFSLERVGRPDVAAHVRRNPSALPMAYVVPRARVVGEKDDVLAVTQGAADPRDAVIMTHDPLDGDGRQPFTPAGWASDEPDAAVIRVATAAPGLLVVGTTWMPGWTARVDGRPAPVLRGNHWQQVVPIRGPGRHEVVLSYQPPGWKAGCAVSGLALLIWAGAAVAVGVRALGWKAARSRPPMRGLPTCRAGFSLPCA